MSSEEDLQTAEDLQTFRSLLKQWNGPPCKFNFNLCKYAH